MKKLFLVCLTCLAMGRMAKAQVVIQDTLRYFLNKQLFKLPTAPKHPTFYALAAVVNNSAITHVGSIFRNSDVIDVLGLEARVLASDQGASFPNGASYRLYLCNVVGDLPVFPMLDSISGSVYLNQPVQTGIYAGGTFTAPVTVTGDYAVLIRGTSGSDGDTVKVLRTAGHTATSTTAPSAAHRFGESLGVLRDGNGNFQKTTNYNHPFFGIGTDYELCVAPIVQFTINVSQIESTTQEGACCWEVFTNTNTSTYSLRNPQSNFNEFYRKWKPFSANMPTSFIPDSVFTWDLGDGSPLYYSTPGSNTVNLSFVSGNCNQFYTGTLTGKYQKQASHSSPTFTTGLTFTSSTVYCGGDTLGTGIYPIGLLATIKAYPNPTADKVLLSGLTGSNTVLMYDLTGRLVATQVSDKATCVVDLLKQPRGIYLIRITDSENRSRVMKVFKE